MARGFLKRRTLVTAAVIVALSVGIVFASIPYLPHAPNSIAAPQVYTVPAGSSVYPGFHSLILQGLLSGESFAVSVTVTGGTANFCVIEDSPYQIWARSSNSPAWSAFPWNDCILQQQTSQSTLTFTATSDGTWDVASLNTSPAAITVNFLPA